MSEEELTEVGRFEFGKDGRVVLSKSDKPLTYYKTHWFTWTWVACLASDGKGCAALRQARLSLDRAPPTLRDQPSVAPLAEGAFAPAQTQAERDFARLEKVIKVMDGIHHWWTKPMPSLFSPATLQKVPASAPAMAVAASAPETPLRSIPSFDIQQIPEVMDKLKLPVSAQMMRHWFAGEANYSVGEKQMIAGIDQNGRPYSPSMIDQSIIKLDWVLGFPRAQKAYDELLSTAIYAPRAVAEIERNLLAYMDCRSEPFAPLNGMTVSGLDIHRLHANFQFQRVGVDAKRLEKVIQWLAGDAGTMRVPDDLAGALGAFSIYAALGNVSFNYASRIARVESIYVYVRDSYSFLDDDASQSQYLGHWNQDGVYLAPLPAVGQGGLGRWISAPLADINRSIYEKGAIMYPVSNKSFRDWRTRHIQGGDFIAYTRPRHIRLTKDLLVSLR